MVFKVAARNRDDRTKNIAFLMERRELAVCSRCLTILTDLLRSSPTFAIALLRLASYAEPTLEASACDRLRGGTRMYVILLLLSLLVGIYLVVAILRPERF